MVLGMFKVIHQISHLGYNINSERLYNIDKLMTFIYEFS